VQAELRLVEGDPSDLVDLVVRDERDGVDGVGQPVADRLRDPSDLIAHGAQLGSEPYAPSGFLGDLAYGAKRRRLPLRELALGQRPVVVPRPVHREHLAAN